MGCGNSGCINSGGANWGINYGAYMSGDWINKEHKNKWFREYYQSLRDYRIAHSLCPRCGNQREGKSHCPTCLEKYRVMYHKRKKKNECNN